MDTGKIARGQWSLDKKTTAAFAVAFALLVAVGFTSRTQVANFEESSAGVAHTHEVMAVIENAQLDLADAQIDMRTYVLVGNERYLTAYRTATQAARRKLQRLRTLTAGNPDQQQRLDALEPLIEKRFRLLEELMAIRKDQGLEAALEQIRTGGGNEIMEDIRRAFGEMKEARAALLQSRVGEASADARRTTVTLTASVLLALILVTATMLLVNRHVGRRDAAEAAWQNQTKLLQSIVENIADAVVVADERGRFVLFNPAAEQILGIGVTDAIPGEWTGHYGLFLPDMATPCPTDDVPLVRALRGRATDGAELFVRNAKLPDGLWLRVSGRPLTDEAGMTRGGVVVFQNITAQKQAHETLEARVRERTAELNELRHRYALILNSAAEGIFGLDLEGKTTFANAAALTMTGWEADEMIGKPQHAMIHHTKPDGTPYPQQECPIYAAFRDGTVHRIGDEVFWRKDGASFPVEYTSNPIRNDHNEIMGAVVVFKDITERKRAEEVLRASEARKAAILESALDAIITINHEGNIIEFNPAAEGMFGYSRSAVMGQPLAERIIPPSFRDGHRRGIAHYLATGEGPVLGKRIEITGMRSGGAEFPVELAITQFTTEGAPMFTATVRDVTERKRAEGQVRALNAELEGQVLKFAEANRELTQKSQENEMFVYSVSHDLRSPLVNLQGFSKELEKGCQQLAALFADESVPAAAREPGLALLGGKMAKSLGFIQSAVLRLSNIIEALLRLSRAGRVEYRWESVDIARVIARVVDSAHGTATERHARFAVGELPPAWGDATSLEQLFANLIGNALTYLDPVRPGVIEVGCLPAADGFRTYYVRDNGLGIAEGHRAKIFQMFQRAHPGVGKGEGIGLAIVARVAERHRGKVWVETRVGEGSTFFVALPAVPERSPTR